MCAGLAPDGHAISVILLDANDDSEVASPRPPRRTRRSPPTGTQGHDHRAIPPKGKDNQARYAASSPDGKQLAVSANWRSEVLRPELIPMNKDLPMDGKKSSR